MATLQLIEGTMTDPKAKLADLRDLWEGCFERDTAISMAGLDYHPVVKAVAEALWDNWTEAFDND